MRLVTIFLILSSILLSVSCSKDNKVYPTAPAPITPTTPAGPDGNYSAFTGNDGGEIFTRCPVPETFRSYRGTRTTLEEIRSQSNSWYRRTSIENYSIIRTKDGEATRVEHNKTNFNRVYGRNYYRERGRNEIHCEAASRFNRFAFITPSIQTPIFYWGNLNQNDFWSNYYDHQVDFNFTFSTNGSLNNTRYNRSYFNNIINNNSGEKAYYMLDDGNFEVIIIDKSTTNSNRDYYKLTSIIYEQH